MAEKPEIIKFSQKRFFMGMTNFLKEDVPNAFYYSQSIDHRTDPQAITLLPAALKESGSIVTDLLKCADTTPEVLDVYSYGGSGNLYKRTTAGSWSNLHTVPASHGNGLSYFYGDDYLYYASDKTLGRYGPINATPQFVDNFLGAQGGIPTNTASLSLVAASSQYATAADSASLSVTGNLTLEAEFYLNSFPTVGNSMTILGKWDESTNIRSYKLDIYGVSGYFGDGSDGSLTISSDTTESPIDSACTGTAGTQTLSATNVSFAAGQQILIHQTQGTNAGKWERNTIQGYTAGTITTGTPLANSYTSGAQVRVLKQYTSVTINAGKTYKPKAWNGSVGGVLAFLANGTVTVTGNISADACGFRGGSTTVVEPGTSFSGEGTTGVSIQTNNANGNGGGGTNQQQTTPINAAGGGGNGTAGQNGAITDGTINPGFGGAISGSNDLTTMTFGGGGGGSIGSDAKNGGIGGGIVFIIAVTLTITGTISSIGASPASTTDGAGSGAGAGGSILVKIQTATLGSSLITAPGGTGGSGVRANGGNGGNGRVAVAYLTSYTGTTSPTLNASQDNTLVTSTTYQARLGISNDGTAFEYLTMNLSGLTTGMWNRLSVAWTASTSTAQFYLNAVLLGTSVGAKTAIHDNASLLYIGANKTSVVANFFDGLLDDMRIFGNVQSASQIYANNEVELTGSEGGLKAYYTYDNVLTDKTSNANNLTNHSTTFSTNVPYPAPTTRLDIDQSYTITGDTYAVPTAISEATTDQLPFTPGLDPQKSIDLKISAKGTGNWTVTIHDTQNNVIATQTITNANMASGGYQEFIFTTPWRIVIGRSYHAHVTSTVNDGVLVSSSNNNLATGDFHTYYQFLVNDTNFHPIARLLNKIVVGNERYLATWDGATYSANFLAFPPQTHIRCFGYWREYLAIGVWQETLAGSGNIYDWNVGRIYFWDGISLQFNFWIDIAEGQINAMYGLDTNLYIWAGFKGDMVIYQGGYVYASGNTMTSKVKRMPLMERQNYMEVYPQAVCSWRGLLHFGVAANSNSTTLPRGVYSFGTLTPPYPETLSGNDYPISTGNTGSSVSIGLVYPAGQTLLIGWQDGSAFGCDQVNFLNNAVARSGTLQLNAIDNEEIWHQEEPLKLRADHLALNTGEGISIKYKIDRETNWEGTGSITDSQTTKWTTNQIANGRGREYQVAVDFAATNGTSPTLLGISGLVQMLRNEQQL